MQYRNLLVKSAVLAMSLSSVSALAGQAVGNGGGGFICKDTTQNELLDLFEAQMPGLVTENGLKIERSDAPVDAQLHAVLGKLGTDTWLYQDLERFYRLVRAAKQYTVPAGYVAWPADAVNTLTKPDCKQTGLVSFKDYPASKWVDQQSVDALPNTDQAALWVHETVYKFLRASRNEPNSIRARKLVGHLFSSESPEELRRAFISIIGLDPYEQEPRTIQQIVYNNAIREVAYPSNSGPRSCPAGQKLVEIGFWNDSSLGVGWTGGYVFASGKPSNKQNSLASLTVPAGLISYWSPKTTVCLPPGSYRYVFNWHGANSNFIEAPGGTGSEVAYIHFKNAENTGVEMFDFHDPILEGPLMFVNRVAVFTVKP